MSEIMQMQPIDNVHESSSDKRQIVAYFDHEFIAPTVKKLGADVHEIVTSGFTDVVLCVTEGDIASLSRQAYLKDAVSLMKERGLIVSADPWGVGNSFGGEGASDSKASGEVACMHNPKLLNLFDKWVDVTASIEVSSIFLDEPEMKCKDHLDLELPFIEYCVAAVGRLALTTTVCLCANESKKDQFTHVASLPNVTGIATDPYYPNAFARPPIPENRRLEYVTDWTKFIADIGEQFNIRSDVWVQAFGVPVGQERMVAEHIGIAKASKVGGIALWGYRGCASVPDFHNPGQAAPVSLWETAKAAFKK